MTNKQLIRFLRSADACQESIAWVGTRNLAQAWAECERPDWMLWLLARTISQHELVLTACACARPALQYIPSGEDRPRIAIETVEAWAKGEATLQQVQAATRAVYDAVYAASPTGYDVGSAATLAACYAAVAASYSDAVVTSNHAYYAASNAAYAHAYAFRVSRKQSLIEQCNIIRSRFPTCPPVLS